ncbi:MAG: N-acetyltransferase family protein [Nocardioidaceae bacterium]
MDIREIDPHDEALLRRHWEIGYAAQGRHRPYNLHWPWEAARSLLQGGAPDSDFVLLAAFDGDRMSGAADLNLPTRDNTHLALGRVFADPTPDRPRAGVGRALVDALCERARDLGRRTVAAEVYAPPGGTSPGLELARAAGFAEVLEEQMKVVDLNATEHLWDALAAQAAAHHDGYRVVSWEDAAPPEFVGGLCRLQELFNAEAPTGELDVEQEVWDEHRLRETEAMLRRIGRHVVTTVAVAPDGAVVGFSTVGINAASSWRGMQSGTIVDPAHRGHRLGVAMKVANHRAIRTAHPETRVVFTGNAGVNAAMNAVNDRLGFHVVERAVAVQKEL